MFKVIIDWFKYGPMSYRKKQSELLLQSIKACTEIGAMVSELSIAQSQSKCMKCL